LFKRLTTLFTAFAVLVFAQTLITGTADAADVRFSKEFVEDPKIFAEGKKIWIKQCARCHGQRAYPGKAPKLKPSKYKIDFVYKRVTKGFRGMPSWKRKYNKHQRMAVSAYIMHPDFKN